MRHGEQRIALIGHATEALEQDGLESVTIRGVARRAGLSHGAPLRHFPDLRALLSAVSARGFDELLNQLRHAHMDGEPIDRLSQLANDYVGFAIERPALFELMFRHDLLEGSGENLRSHSRPIFDLVLQAVTAAGVADAETVTTDLWAAVHGIAVLTSRRSIETITHEDAGTLVNRQLRAHLHLDD